MVAEKIDDPKDLAEAQSLDDELNRASELSRLPVKITQTTKGTKKSRKTTHTSGKNGWIFCTSIEPLSPKEWDAWWNSMEDGYDHASYIHRPRSFARALASMVAEQLGPLGAEAKIASDFSERYESKTKHKMQAVFHGPVIYVDNPYDTLSRARSSSEEMLLSTFVKGIQYQDQREYRFAIWSDSEPEEEIVYLDASASLLAAMEEPLAESDRVILPTVASFDESSESEPEPMALETDKETGSFHDLYQFVPMPPYSGLLNFLDSGLRRNDGGRFLLCALHLKDYGAVMTNWYYPTFPISTLQGVP